MVVASLLAAAPAQAAGSASVSGTIVGPGPLGLSEVEVMELTLSVSNGDSWRFVTGDELRNGENTFSFTGLDAGDYRLEVKPEAEKILGGGYRLTVREFTLETGHVNIDVSLTRGGYVRGKVTGGDENIFVELYYVHTVNGREVWDPYGNDTVAPGGTYDIDIPFSGVFVLQAASKENKFWAPDTAKSSFTQDQHPTVDFTMRQSAQITGTVSFNPADLGTPQMQEDDGGNFVYAVVQREASPAYWTTATYAAHLSAPGKFTLWVPGAGDNRSLRVVYYDDWRRFPKTYWDGTTYGTASADAAKLFTTTSPIVYSGRDITLRKAAPPKPPKKAATLKISAKPGKGKATVTVKVSASGVSASKVTGKVTISRKQKVLKTGSVKKGKAKVTITRQKKGKQTYTVKYLGNDKVKAATKSIKIKIK
ncbi:MAG: Ig-like domain repeat protein [Microlunatus sp.]